MNERLQTTIDCFEQLAKDKLRYGCDRKHSEIESRGESKC